jgi:hypothetical protein
LSRVPTSWGGVKVMARGLARTLGAGAGGPGSAAQRPPARVPACLFGLKADPNPGATSDLVTWVGAKFAAW